MKEQQVLDVINVIGYDMISQMRQSDNEDYRNDMMRYMFEAWKNKVLSEAVKYKDQKPVFTAFDKTVTTLNFKLYNLKSFIAKADCIKLIEDILNSTNSAAAELGYMPAQTTDDEINNNSDTEEENDETTPEARCDKADTHNTLINAQLIKCFKAISANMEKVLQILERAI